MNVQFNEWGNGVNIELTPENKTETLELLRYSNNAKREKPSIYLSFKTGVCSIYLKKVKEIVQKTSISKY